MKLSKILAEMRPEMDSVIQVGRKFYYKDVSNPGYGKIKKIEGDELYIQWFFNGDENDPFSGEGSKFDGDSWDVDNFKTLIKTGKICLL